eukprot:6768313-Prymnesium_polylepis.1
MAAPAPRARDRSATPCRPLAVDGVQRQTGNGGAFQMKDKLSKRLSRQPSSSGRTRCTHAIYAR